MRRTAALEQGESTSDPEPAEGGAADWEPPSVDRKGGSFAPSGADSTLCSSSRPPTSPLVTASVDFRVTVGAAARFHATAGARVALRNSALGLAVVVFVIGMAPEPVALLRALAVGTAAAGAPPTALYLIALLGLALTRQAQPQVAAGRMGWLRSLPASAGAQRRAVTAALVVVQAPALLFALCCAAGVALAPGMRLSAVKLVALVPIAVGAAITGTVRRKPLVVIMCIAAVVLAASGGAPGLAASIIPLAAADRLAGFERPRRQGRPWRSRSRLELHIAWRAVTWRALPPLLVAALPLAAAWFYTVNNELTPHAAAAATRLCGGIAELFVLSGLSDALALRRPVWGWARSLPLPSTQRIRLDATLLAFGLMPVLFVAAIIDVAGAIVLAAAAPLLSLIAAGAIRHAGLRLTAAGGEVLVVGGAVVAALSVTPWSLVPCLLMMPLVLRRAARRERVRPVSRWLELHHLPRGDGLWWNAP